MPSVIASKMAEMRRGGLGKKEFIRDPNPVGAHSEKKTKSKRDNHINWLCRHHSQARDKIWNYNVSAGLPPGFNERYFIGSDGVPMPQLESQCTTYKLCDPEKVS